MADAGTRALLNAAQTGNLEAIDQALAQGVPVDPVPAGQDSPLVLAVMFGQVAATRRLLEAGANVRHVGAMGRTALHYAAARSLELTQLVLARKPDVMARDSSDESALERFILHAGSDRLELGIIDALLAAGFDLRARGTKYAGAGRSPLAWACYIGFVPTVEKLIAAGLDVNEGDPPGCHVFGQALGERDVQKRRAVLATLVAHGLDPNASDRIFGRTLLTELVQLGDADTARRILERGANPDHPHARSPALVLAHERGDAVMKDLLLEFGATPLQRTIPAKAAAALEQTRIAAVAAPGDGAARLAYARSLQEAGYLAAAAAELQAAAALGVTEGSAVPTFESPEGRCEFIDFEPRVEGVAPVLEDGFFPGARVRRGDVSLPLVLAQLRRCTACDAEFTVVCHECNGTGTRPGFFNPDHEYDCEPRVPCGTCGQSGFVLSVGHRSKGTCAHPAWTLEAKGERFTLERCTQCGVPGVSAPSVRHVTGCAICGRIACACPES